MGIKPLAYRLAHEVEKRTGYLKRKFPTSFTPKKFIDLEQWRTTAPAFFFNCREELKEFKLEDTSELKSAFQNIQKGNLLFFNGTWIKLGKGYDWITNPDTQYQYDISKHWTELDTLDPEAGDIKYVWEKSRFSYLYTIIRYDYHFKEDQSEFVFKEILSWIESNPLNMGPNYICSQEISIRVLNWTFALYYYKNSPNLTEERLEKILNSVYWQTDHVKKNINFSLHTVRNNHAVTESLLLYSVGMLYPCFKESRRWREEGKKLLEEEAFYQIYEDGSYLQFSMNYQRVVIQLYTWAFFLAKANRDRFSTGLYERINRGLNFLYEHQDEETGLLPNYGANDGALFFPLNNCSFRDYRPQINALYYFFRDRSIYDLGEWNEDIFWFTNKAASENLPIHRKTRSFEAGGYYLLRDEDKFSFIRCGSHRDRPSQADNLHLDIWVKGVNILRDAGSYKYNTTPEERRFFMGTASHNTVMLGDYDQMEKGDRFLWFHWSKALEAKIENHHTYHLFTGKINAYRHVKKSIYHTRIIKQYKKEAKWEIEDILENSSFPAKQIWNPSPEFSKAGFQITSTDQMGKPIEPTIIDSFYSPTYGVKEKAKQIIFETELNYFKTTIFRKEF